MQNLCRDSLNGMRGDERIQEGMFSYVRLEQRVPEDHPLRAVRKLTDQVLRSLSPGFDELYAASGRPSIAPEYILRPCCCRCSTPSVRSGCWSSRSTTTCSFAGSSASAWTMRCGTTRCFRRTATGC